MVDNVSDLIIALGSGYRVFPRPSVVSLGSIFAEQFDGVKSFSRRAEVFDSFEISDQLSDGGGR